jgi:hypothetical protein
MNRNFRVSFGLQKDACGSWMTALLNMNCIEVLA